MSSYLPPSQQSRTADVITLTRRLFNTACAGGMLVTMTRYPHPVPRQRA
jgi:hypothetical protein